MDKINKRYIIAGLLLIVAVIGIIAFILTRHDYITADKKELKDIHNRIEEELPSYEKTEDIAASILAWADSESLKYTVDDYDNIIFTHKSDKDKKDIPATVICIAYNKFQIEDNSYAIAAGEYLAKNGLNGTRANIVFLNNRQNLNEGVKRISAKYFPSGSNIIYLDSGKTSYISRQSYTQTDTDICIPYEEAPRKCDSGIRVKITGITPDAPTSAIKNQPNPISTMNSVITKCRSKALSFQIADINVENKGNQYPAGIEFTLLINSYSIDTMTKYLDSKAEDYVDDFKEKFPDISFTYEVYEDASMLPDTAYADTTTNDLFNLIYTVKNGTYRFKEDETPDGFERGQVYGINCYEDIRVDGNKLILSVNTTALSSTYLDSIMDDNSLAAELSGAMIHTTGTAPEFNNLSTEFEDRIQTSYNKVNDATAKVASIKYKSDNYFTPCSYLISKNRDLDTVHIRISKLSYYKIINAIINCSTYDIPIWS